MMKPNKKRNPLKRPPLRSPGQSDEEKSRSLSIDIAIAVGVAVLFIFLAALEWWRWYRNLQPNPILFLCLALIVVSLMYFKIRHLLIEKGRWEQGKQGEIEVAQILEELSRDNGYDNFHDFQCSSNGKIFNIDHIIVSPHGIFAIETKMPSKPLSTENRIDFDGNNKITIFEGGWNDTDVPQAISNARWLSEEILPKNKDNKAFSVIPVVVYPGWLVKGPKSTKHVWVLNPKFLQWRIPQEPQSLTPEEVKSVSAVLRTLNR